MIDSQRARGQIPLLDADTIYFRQYSNSDNVMHKRVSVLSCGRFHKTRALQILPLDTIHCHLSIFGSSSCISRAIRAKPTGSYKNLQKAVSVVFE